MVYPKSLSTYIVFDFWAVLLHVSQKRTAFRQLQFAWSINSKDSLKKTRSVVIPQPPHPHQSPHLLQQAPLYRPNVADLESPTDQSCRAPGADPCRTDRHPTRTRPVAWPAGVSTWRSVTPTIDGDVIVATRCRRTKCELSKCHRRAEPRTGQRVAEGAQNAYIYIYNTNTSPSAGSK